MSKTFKDFPEFYTNPFIRSIAKNERWSVSDKNKRPIDMFELMSNHRIWGANINSDTNPCVDLETLCNVLPDAANNAYYLNALVDGYVVLDIEPICPDDIKEAFFKTDYVYGEVSMSGKGYHLVYKLPDSIKKYPIAQKKIKMKEEHKYYEILLNQWVTFTRNMIDPPVERTDDFEALFEEMASKQTESHKVEFDIDNMKPDDIPNGDYILDVLSHCFYRKTLKDFYDDISRYEYGYIGFLHYNLNQILNISHIKQSHTYTPSEKAWLLYETARNEIPHRAKHDELRDGLPWLLYLSREIVAKAKPFKKR